MRFKKGELVWVRTRCYSPQMDGAFYLKRVKHFSNYPYRVEYEGEEQLIERSEVYQITFQLPPQGNPRGLSKGEYDRKIS